MTGLVKLAAAGLLCSGLLSLGGKGAGREILRFGCACLMIVLVMTMVRGADLSLTGLEGYKTQIQDSVQKTHEENRLALLRQTEQDLARELERQAESLSLNCRAAVLCRVDQKDVVWVEQVTVFYHAGPRESLGELRQRIVSLLAVPEGQIIIREEEKP